MELLYYLENFVTFLHLDIHQSYIAFYIGVVSLLYIHIFLPKFLNEIKLETINRKTTICLILQDMFRIHH